MISIWFFVALAVAFVAVFLLGRGNVAHTINTAKCEDRADGHDVKADGGERSGKCCH